VERHESPTVSPRLLCLAGGVDEPVGKTGLAHMVEHMMFKGTKTIGTKNYKKEKALLEEINRLAKELIKEKDKPTPDSTRMKELEDKFKEAQTKASEYVETGELSKIYNKHGAQGLNAGTGEDLTVYIVDIPANKLELWARILADRFENPVFRQFYEERDVVMEERRMRTDNEPTGLLQEKLISTAFDAHPYRNPVIGWASDIERLTMDDIEQFYRTYYVPSNAVLTIVGDVDANHAINIVEKYFSHIPGGEEPPTVHTTEPKQKGEKRIEVEFDAKPEVYIGYHVPTCPDRDTYVLDVINAILSRGRTSRLYKKMIEKDKIALLANTSNWTGRYPNLFVFHGAPKAPHTTAELGKSFYEEIEKLKAEPVEDRELQKVKNQVKANFIRQIQSNGGLAIQLAYYEGFFGGWEAMVEYKDIIESITADEIMEVANKYFGKENRTVATLVEKKPEGVRPLIEIAKEIYEEKSGEKPTEEVVEALSQMIDKFDEAEEMYGRTFSRDERIEMIKQSIEMILKQK